MKRDNMFISSIYLSKDVRVLEQGLISPHSNTYLFIPVVTFNLHSKLIYQGINRYIPFNREYQTKGLSGPCRRDNTHNSSSSSSNRVYNRRDNTYSIGSKSSSISFTSGIISV